MENIYDTSYVAAVQNKNSKTPLEVIIFYAKLLVDILVVIVLSLPNFVQSAIYCFIIRPQKSVRGQLALVTGAGNGIGRQLALRLAREGCNLVIVDINCTAAEKTAADARKLNVKAVAFPVDIADFQQVKQLKVDIEREMGATVDILINNAAILPKMSLYEGTEEEIERIIRVNITSHFFVSSFMHGISYIFNMF